MSNAAVVALTQAIANETTVENACFTLIDGIAKQIVANLANPVALKALADGLVAESDKLVAATAK